MNHVLYTFLDNRVYVLATADFNQFLFWSKYTRESVILGNEKKAPMKTCGLDWVIIPDCLLPEIYKPRMEELKIEAHSAYHEFLKSNPEYGWETDMNSTYKRLYYESVIVNDEKVKKLLVDSNYEI